MKESNFMLNKFIISNLKKNDDTDLIVNNHLKHYKIFILV